jgi:hypothetical protein
MESARYAVSMASKICVRVFALPKDIFEGKKIVLKFNNSKF